MESRPAAARVRAARLQARQARARVSRFPPQRARRQHLLRAIGTTATRAARRQREVKGRARATANARGGGATPRSVLVTAKPPLDPELATRRTLRPWPVR